jgi:hypothetical protein
MGIAAADIDVTGATATYTGWSLTFNGGWASSHPRAEVIADMLCECHSTLQITDQIELHVLSKTAQGDALTTSDLRDFRYSKVTRSANDSSYIAWQESGKPQDRFKKCLVAAKSSTDNPSNDTFQIRFVQDSQDVQRIGSLRNQRRFLRQADVSFTGLFNLIRFQPADVVSINHNAYGGSYNIMLDSVWIKPNGDIHFSGTRYSDTLDDWSDLTPGAVSVATDDTAYTWSPVFQGPDSATSKYPNLMSGRVRVNENVILDPTDGITLLNGGNLTVEDGGDILVEDGGDITLTNENNTNPAKLIFSDEYNSQSFEVYTEYDEDDDAAKLTIDALGDGSSNSFYFYYSETTAANLESMFGIKGEAAVIELIDVTTDPDKYWYIVNHNSYLDIREDTRDGANNRLRIEPDGVIKTYGDITDAGGEASVNSNIVRSMASKTFWSGTQTEYNAIGSPDSDTIYFVTPTTTTTTTTTTAAPTTTTTTPAPTTTTTTGV